MKKYSLRIVLALFVAMFSATIAAAAPKLYVGNGIRGFISTGETSVTNNIYFTGLTFEVNDTGEATTGTLKLTTSKQAWGAYFDDNNALVSEQPFEPGKEVVLHLKKGPGTGEGYMVPCDASGNRLSVGSTYGDNQIAFSGASFKLKVGSEPEVSGTIPTFRRTTDLTDSIGMPYITLRYSEDRDMIEGVDWKFVKKSDPKTTMTYHTGDPMARIYRIRAIKFEGARENKYVDKTFADGEKMEGSVTFDEPIEQVDLSRIIVFFKLSDSLDTSKADAAHTFSYYMQGDLFLDQSVTIRQSFGKEKGGEGTYVSLGEPKAIAMSFEVTGQGANKTGTFEFTPPKDVTASFSRSGVVEAAELYKAGVKKTLDLNRHPGTFSPYMDVEDPSGRRVSFRAVDGSDDPEENIYALNGTRFVAKIGSTTIEDTVPNYKKVSELIRSEAVSNIRCTVNSEGKITKVDWWFTKADDRTVAAKFAVGDEINYVGSIQIRGRKGNERVYINAPGFGRSFSSGETMSGTWELTEDQYISVDDVQSIRVRGQHRYQSGGSWRTIHYSTHFVPVAESIDASDVKDDGSDGANVKSAAPNQPTPSEIASAIEDLFDALKKVMAIIKDSPMLKAFDVINTINMNVEHTRDDGTAKVVIENFDREPKSGHEFVVMTKRKITMTDAGKWDMHRGVRYDKDAKKLSFSIPNVGSYFSSADVVLAEVQIDNGSKGSSGGAGCAAGAAVMLALGCLVAIKARKR